ncbi:MAG: hypothetical protein PHW00_00490 [Clostridia bacterium]|nr:hypothetical protein [Clostridia bacterium]
MSFNPFKEKPLKIDEVYMDWKDMSVKPYNCKSVHPFTKLRLILLNGAEFEAVKFSHCFSRNCDDNDLRRELCLIRRSEQQQQKRLASFKPFDESILEHTIGYEQLAVELTSMLAQLEADPYVKKTLDFALLEDFDHLYRYADLLDIDEGIKAEQLVGELTEIMPGRPTIAEHRFPADDIKRYSNFAQSSLQTKLNVNIITAAEQQTMNYYMNIGNFYKNKLGRDLYAEIAMIEEQHVSSYGSLLDTTCTWLENLLMHEYTECYLYYSAMNDEKDKRIRDVYEQMFTQEIAHLHNALYLLNKYEKKEYQQVVGKGDFPQLLLFKSNIDYVRNVLANTINLTGYREDYVDVTDLKEESDFVSYQKTVNDPLKSVASHQVINKYIALNGNDYRFQVKQHPVQVLQNRQKDNTSVGRQIN